MKMLMFSVFDVKVKGYMQPFFALAKGQAMRSFGDQVVDGQSPISKHAEDYSLFLVGDFDLVSGRVADFGSAPEYICKGVDFVEAKPQVLGGVPSGEA